MVSPFPVGTGDQFVADCGQKLELNTQFIAERERADLLSDSTLHRT